MMLWKHWPKEDTWLCQVKMANKCSISSTVPSSKLLTTKRKDEEKEWNDYKYYNQGPNLKTREILLIRISFY